MFDFGKVRFEFDSVQYDNLNNDSHRMVQTQRTLYLHIFIYAYTFTTLTYFIFPTISYFLYWDMLNISLVLFFKREK